MFCHEKAGHSVMNDRLFAESAKQSLLNAGAIAVHFNYAEIAPQSLLNAGAIAPAFNNQSDSKMWERTCTA
jgi:hypothetical protein